MGVVDDFKSEKNKDMIILAAEKMLKDKYAIVIEREELKAIINSVSFTICSDVVLIKSVVKIMELNTIALAKVKEYIDNREREREKNDNVPDINNDTQIQSVATDEEIAKYNSEELLTKVLQLEEKRNAINALASTQMNKGDLNQGLSSITGADPQKVSQVSQLSQLSQVSQRSHDNTNMYAIIEKLDDVINRKKYINYKSLVINSYNRDWINYPLRNKLSLSVNIDFNKNLIEPDKLLLPKNIKTKTPYITMIISDGKQSQKFQFIASTAASTASNTWDTWVLLNSDREYSRNIILLNNKNWHISFTDYLNKDLDMGRDCIKISKIRDDKKDEDNEDEEDEDEEDEDDDDGDDDGGEDDDESNNYYNIVISNKKKGIRESGYDLNLVNKYDTLLLGSVDGINIPIKVLDINSNTMKVGIDKKFVINTRNNYYLLNYKAQYTIILTYYSKI